MIDVAYIDVIKYIEVNITAEILTNENAHEGKALGHGIHINQLLVSSIMFYQTCLN